MYNKNPPLFPFGHGLTYTSFSYSGYKLSKNTLRDGETVDISFTLKNTGNHDSEEVVQLYVSFPESRVEQPSVALKGFKRVYVPTGGTVSVTIPLKADDLKYWDSEQQKWLLEPGKVKFFIGASSSDKKLDGVLSISK